MTNPLFLRRRSNKSIPYIPPIPSGDKLAWSPPTAGAGGVTVVNYALTNANRGSIPLGAGRDLVLTCSEVLNGPLSVLQGWRHVIWIRGEFLSTTANVSQHISPADCSGIVHLEGIKYRSSTYNDVIAPRHFNGGPAIQALQIQNCDLQNTKAGSGYHSDTFQTQYALINSLRVDKVTFSTDYQGWFIQNEPGRTPPAQVGEVRMSRTNCNVYGGVPPSGTYYNKAIPNTPYAELELGPWYLSDVWMPQIGSPGMNIGPNSNFYDYIHSTYCKYGCFIRSDAQGNYAAFSTTSDTVPVGTYAGQAASNCGIMGVIRIGTPPGGNFCTTAGMSYISPGYV